MLFQKQSLILISLFILVKLLGLFKYFYILQLYGANMYTDSYFYALSYTELLASLGLVGGPIYFTGLYFIKSNEGEARKHYFFSLAFLSSFLFFMLFLFTMIFSKDISLVLTPFVKSSPLEDLVSESMLLMSPKLFFVGLISPLLLFAHYKKFFFYDMAYQFVSIALELLLISMWSKSFLEKAISLAYGVSGSLAAIFLILLFAFKYFGEIRNSISKTNIVNAIRCFKGVVVLFFENLNLHSGRLLFLYLTSALCSAFPLGVRTNFEIANRIVLFIENGVKNVLLVPVYPMILEKLALGKKHISSYVSGFLEKLNTMLILFGVLIAMFFSEFSTYLRFAFSDFWIVSPQSDLLIAILGLGLIFVGMEIVLRRYFHATNQNFKLLIIDYISYISAIIIIFSLINKLSVYAIAIGIISSQILRLLMLIIKLSYLFEFAFYKKFIFSFSLTVILSYALGLMLPSLI